MDSSVPYLSLIVVTKHDTNPTLFNTKFRLNFGRSQVNHRTEPHNTLTSLTIGRSSQCNMILDYRTVSINHAKISYENDEFLLQDRSSSNGTMVYVREPVPLPYGRNVRFRMGRCTLNVQAKRSWLASVRGSLNRASTSLRRTSMLPRFKGDAPPQTPSDFFEQLTRSITMYNAQVTTALQKAQRERSLERSRAIAAEKMVAAADVEAVAETAAGDITITSSNGNTNGISSSEKQLAQSMSQISKERIESKTSVSKKHLLGSDDQNGAGMFAVPEDIRNTAAMANLFVANDDDNNVDTGAPRSENGRIVDIGVATNVENSSSSNNVDLDTGGAVEAQRGDGRDKNDENVQKEQNGEDENFSLIEGQLPSSGHIDNKVSSMSSMSAPPTSCSPNATDASYNDVDTTDSKTIEVNAITANKAIELKKETGDGELNDVCIERDLHEVEDMILMRGSSPSYKVSPHRASTPRKLEFPNASTPRGGSVVDAEYSVSMPNTVISPTGLALPTTEQHDVVLTVDHDTPSSPHRAKETSPSSDKPMTKGSNS